jgi:hypothetical protein
VGVVVLDKGLGDAIGRELGPPVGLQEEATIIPKTLRLDEDNVWNL